MTIEQLVGKSADELEALTDEQLREYFAPYLHFVRPTEEVEIVREVKKANFGKDKQSRIEAILKMIP